MNWLLIEIIVTAAAMGTVGVIVRWVVVMLRDDP